MAVVGVDVTSRTPFAEGRSFGSAGAYERIEGIFTFAVDPAHEANLGITDLALAPRDTDGRVRFASDFTLLVPADPALGNRRLIVDVVNRGRRQVAPTFNLAVPNRQGSADIPVGDGFLFRRGYSVASVGWQSDVYRSDMLLGIDAPVAYEGGKPVRGQVVVEVRPDTCSTRGFLPTGSTVRTPSWTLTILQQGCLCGTGRTAHMRTFPVTGGALPRRAQTA